MNLLKTLLITSLLLSIVSCSNFQKELRVGVSADYPPITFKDDKGNYSGLENDYAQMLATEMRAELKRIQMPFAELIPALEKGEIDIIMSGMTKNEARSFKVRFLPPHMTLKYMIILSNENIQLINAPLKQVNDSFSLAYINGTISEEIVKQDLPENESKAYEDIDKCIKAIKSGEVDALIHESPSIAKYDQEEYTLSALVWGANTDSLAWAIKYEDGKMYKEILDIYQKWKLNGTLKKTQLKWVPEY
jgi:ABC-type amino acid transport substrate-binding protein